MRSRIVVLMLSAAPWFLSAQSSTTVALQSSPNSAVLGAPVTLTATVTPSSSTGKVTFYDGVTILGVAPLSNGQAVFIARMLNAGAHTLRAYYAGQSANALQTVNAVAAGGFQPAVNYAAGIWAGGVTAADFNSDGNIDLAISDGMGGLSVLLCNGDGTFQPAINVATSWYPSAIAVGDFNGDGKPDLAMTVNGQSVGGQPAPVGIVILLGNGDGTFQALGLIPFPYEPESLVVIDANHDGKADVVALNQQAATISVLLGNGDGTFGPTADYSVAPFQYIARAMAAGDFNGDGSTDLAVSICPHDCAVGTLSIVLGNGDGTFRLFGGASIGSDLATSVAVADFNGDGIPDLVVSLSRSGVSVALGNGDGTFGIPAITSDTNLNAIPYFAPPLVVADFNGDGILDVAAAGDTTTDGATVALGTGDGTFQTALFYHVGSNFSSGLAAGDFNGDGRTDLAVATKLDNTVGILLGSANPTPTVSSVFVDPSSGGGGSQVFYFEFSDLAGFNDIATVTASIGRSLPAVNGCAVTYNRLQNTLALWNDDGSVPTGIVPGSGSQQNGACSLNGSASSVSFSGNFLTLRLAITFTAAGRGQKTAVAEVVSVTGATSGWQILGSWTAGLPPQAVSVGPSSGTGMAGTFTFTYADPYGASDLLYVQALFQTPTAVCFVVAYPGSGGVLLDGASGSITLGLTGSLQNGNCTVNAAGSKAVFSGNTYTLTLSLTFTSALIGLDSVIGYAENSGFVGSGYQTLGTWTVGPVCTPNTNSITVSDVQRIVNEALGGATMSAADDMNQDSVINVIDVQIAAIGALAAACTFP